VGGGIPFRPTGLFHPILTTAYKEAHNAGNEKPPNNHPAQAAKLSETYLLLYLTVVF
jgi:hypothetical protein